MTTDSLAFLFSGASGGVRALAPSHVAAPPAPLVPNPSEPSWLAHVGDLLRPYTHPVLASLEQVLRWASSRTGLPMIVVAALTLVLALRVARRTWHVVFELALAFALLFAATRMGWIRW